MQKRYTNFAYTLCTNDELVTAGERVGTELEETLSHDEFITHEWGVAKGVISTIITLSSRSQKGEYTIDIDLTDKKRDKLIRVIKRDLKSDIDMEAFDPELAAIARKVQKIVLDNPVDLKAGYSEETAQINALLEVAQKPENVEVIQASSVASKFSMLLNVQSEFERLIAKQAEANSAVPVGEVKAHVIEMVYRLDGILSYIERKAESNPAEYEATANQIAEILDAIMAPARARATKKENEIAI